MSARSSGAADLNARSGRWQPCEAEGEACEGEGLGNAQSIGQAQKEGQVPRQSRLRNWQRRLAWSAAVLRAHLGLRTDDMQASESSGPARALDELAAGLYEYDRPLSAGPRFRQRRRRVTLRLRVRESTAQFYRELEREAQRWLPRGVSFAEFACVSLWKAWYHLLDPTVAYAEIYARDRHRCCCPVCQRRDVTPHHVVFRSRGGDDAPENVIALCAGCHLALLHNGLLRVDRASGKLEWVIGRAGQMEVKGRELARE